MQGLILLYMQSRGRMERKMRPIGDTGDGGKREMENRQPIKLEERKMMRGKSAED